MSGIDSSVEIFPSDKKGIRFFVNNTEIDTAIDTQSLQKQKMSSQHKTAPSLLRITQALCSSNTSWQHVHSAT